VGCFHILDHASTSFQLKILKEVIHIQREQPSLNKQLHHVNLKLLFVRSREQNTSLQLDKQRTLEVQTHRFPKFGISLQYYKGKPLYFKAAIVTSLIYRSVLILSGGNLRSGVPSFVFSCRVAFLTATKKKKGRLIAS